MRMIVFGATGKVGRHLVDQALKEGHDVAAFSRNPRKSDQSSKNLEVVQGDVLDPASVNKAVQERDVVVCAVGMPLLNKDGLRAKGTNNIIRAMESAGVKRLVCLSAFGTGDSRDALPFHYRYLLAPLVMRRMYCDHSLQESHVKNSSLDWVIVRPAHFVDGEHTGQYKNGFGVGDETIKLKISYADVADFMLKQVADNTYLRATPSLSY